MMLDGAGVKQQVETAPRKATNKPNDSAAQEQQTKPQTTRLPTNRQRRQSAAQGGAQKATNQKQQDGAAQKAINQRPQSTN
jgi:hypothetical protein